MVIFVFLKSIVAEIAPQNSSQPHLMGVGKCLRDFNNLTAALVGPEVNRGAYRGGPHVGGLLDSAKHDLVGFIWIGEELVVIDFNQERDLVRVFASHRSENSIGRGNGVAA